LLLAKIANKAANGHITAQITTMGRMIAPPALLLVLTTEVKLATQPTNPKTIEVPRAPCLHSGMLGIDRFAVSAASTIRVKQNNGSATNMKSQECMSHQLSAAVTADNAL
jgi:hypothetical protein